jgi:nucleoside-triphosphatase THEP1
MPGRELTLLTGEVDSGKTTWCASFSQANPGCDGILLRKIYQAGRRIGYDAVRVATGKTLPFSRLKGAEPPNWHPAECVGSFSVSAEGKQAANRWLLEALGSLARGLIVDEIGPLELEGGGLAEAVQAVLQDDASCNLILVVRRSCLEQLIRQYQLAEYRLVEL